MIGVEVNASPFSSIRLVNRRVSTLGLHRPGYAGAKESDMRTDIDQKTGEAGTGGL